MTYFYDYLWRKNSLPLKTNTNILKVVHTNQKNKKGWNEYLYYVVDKRFWKWSWHANSIYIHLVTKKILYECFKTFLKYSVLESNFFLKIIFCRNFIKKTFYKIGSRFWAFWALLPLFLRGSYHNLNIKLYFKYTINFWISLSLRGPFLWGFPIPYLTSHKNRYKDIFLCSQNAI